MKFRVLFSALWKVFGSKVRYPEFLYDFLLEVAGYIVKNCANVAELDKLMDIDVLAPEGKPEDIKTENLCQKAKDRNKTLGWSRDVRFNGVKQKIRGMVNAKESTEGYKLMEAFGGAVLKFWESKTKVSVECLIITSSWLKAGKLFLSWQANLTMIDDRSRDDWNSPLILPFSYATVLALGKGKPFCSDFHDFRRWPSHTRDTPKSTDAHTAVAIATDKDLEHQICLSQKTLEFESDTEFLNWVKHLKKPGTSIEVTEPQIQTQEPTSANEMRAGSNNNEPQLERKRNVDTNNNNQMTANEDDALPEDIVDMVVEHSRSSSHYNDLTLTTSNVPKRRRYETISSSDHNYYIQDSSSESSQITFPRVKRCAATYAKRGRQSFFLRLFWA